MSPFKTLDHDFREGLRQRVDAGRLIDKLQAHAMNPVAYPMTKSQITVACKLLSYILPELKAVEHTDAPRRAETREELLERIANLQPGTSPGIERRPAQGTTGDSGAAEVRH